MKGMPLVTVVVVCLLLPGVAGAQDSTGRRAAVAFSPAVFVPLGLAAQLSVQVRVGKRWAWLTDVAYPVVQPANDDYDDIRHWRAALELKRYLKRKTGRPYISLQAGYHHRELRRNGQSLFYTRTQTFAYSGADINSPVLATALKLGTEVDAGKRTYVDFFAGAGLRAIRTTYTTKSAVPTSQQPEEQGFFSSDDAWLYNYTLHRLHVTAGVRVGFRL